MTKEELKNKIIEIIEDNFDEDFEYHRSRFTFDDCIEEIRNLFDEIKDIKCL